MKCEKCERLLSTLNIILVWAEFDLLDADHVINLIKKTKKNIARSKCSKCGGAGWVWWHELDDYAGPASDPHDCYSDDTKYTCDKCYGEQNES